MTQTRSTTGFQEGYKASPRKAYYEICISSPPNQSRDGFLAETPKHASDKETQTNSFAAYSPRCDVHHAIGGFQCVSDTSGHITFRQTLLVRAEDAERLSTHASLNSEVRVGALPGTTGRGAVTSTDRVR